MRYTEQTWTNGAAGGTPLSAARLGGIERGILLASLLSDGITPIDDPFFRGANDNATFSNWMAFARSETRPPVGMFPARTFGTITGHWEVFDGLRLIGPLGNDGVKNLELDSGNLVNHRVVISNSGGLNSTFQQTAEYQDIVMANIAFSLSASSQFWWNTNPTSLSVYPCQFHSLSCNGGSGFLGNSTNKFTSTQGVFSGHWTVLNYSATPLKFGGSDCHFEWFLNSNSPASVDGNGAPILWLDYLQKSVMFYNYITAENDWTGLRVTGDQDRDVLIVGGTYEGRANTNPATRPVIDIQGGVVRMVGPHIGYVDDTATSLGAITQSGGFFDLEHAHYTRTTNAPDTFPLLYQTGGVAHIYKPKTGRAGEQIRLRWSSGTTDTVAAPSNGYTA